MHSMIEMRSVILDKPPDRLPYPASKNLCTFKYQYGCGLEF